MKCEKCGAELFKDCPECGAVIPIDECSDCGYLHPEEQPKKRRIRITPVGWSEVHDSPTIKLDVGTICLHCLRRALGWGEKVWRERRKKGLL